MITITCVKKPSEEFTLLTGKTYSVGRKSCDLTFTADQSVSRNHATILVDHPIANISNSAFTPSVVVTDLGSKFGTYVNDGIDSNQKVAMREPNTMAHGDKFRFGLQWNEFKIRYTPLISTSSGYIKEANLLRETMCELGAHLLPEWKDGCGFLITESVSLTVKTVCALLSAKYIVTPKFFHDYLDAVKSKTKLPIPGDYLPPIAEKLPKPFSFEPNLARTKLFDRKIFLFATQRQSKKIGVALRCAGGVTDLITSVSPTLLKSENTLIISSTSDIPFMESQMHSAVEVYQSAKKRTIPESEIGLASVYACVERYCNPFFAVQQAVFPQSLISQTQQSSTPGASIAIVPETQQSSLDTQRSVCSSHSSQSRKIVDETVSSQSSAPGPNKSTRGATRVISLTQSQSQPLSQPMEFAVPTPRIKEEKLDDAAPKRRSEKAGRSVNENRTCVVHESSGTKRRREASNALMDTTPSTSAARSESGTKRLRGDSSTNSTRYTTDSSRTLSSIFNLSDDDEPSPAKLPTTRLSVPSTKNSNKAVLVPHEEQEISLNLIPPTPDCIDVINETASTENSANKSPVKQEKRTTLTHVDTENSKRKQPVDDRVEAEPSTSKKRRVDKAPAEITKRLSSDGFIVPTLTSVSKKISVQSYENRKDTPIPESEIKPLPFKFAPLIKKLPRPVIRQIEIDKEGGTRSRSVFNFKSFKKILPLCLNSTIMNNGTTNSCNNSSRSTMKIPLRAYNSAGFTEPESCTMLNRMTKASTAEKVKINIPRVPDESMDLSITEISPTSSVASNSSVRRSARNARGTTIEDRTETPSPSTSTNTNNISPSKRRTRATTKRSDSSPPPLFKEEPVTNPFDPPQKIDDEWAF